MTYKELKEVLLDALAEIQLGRRSPDSIVGPYDEGAGQRIVEAAEKIARYES